MSQARRATPDTLSGPVDSDRARSSPRLALDRPGRTVRHGSGRLVLHPVGRSVRRQRLGASQGASRAEARDETLGGIPAQPVRLTREITTGAEVEAWSLADSMLRSMSVCIAASSVSVSYIRAESREPGHQRAVWRSRKLMTRPFEEWAGAYFRRPGAVQAGGSGAARSQPCPSRRQG